LVISEVVKGEIDNAEPSKREAILHFLSTLKYTLIPYNQESYNLAINYIFNGVLNHNHLNDLLHVAYATVHKCDVIVSWNRKHITKPIKIQKLNASNLKNNYSSIVIYTPEEFLTYFK
jgi:hypothetical protein